MTFPGLSNSELTTLSEQEPNWEVQQIRYGNGRHPIITIDNFSPHAGDLLTDCQAQNFQRHGPYYPGVQAYAPTKYLAPHRQSLGYVLSRAFGYGEVKTEMEMCMYSYVTTPPAELMPLQRYPHYDGGHPRKVALLHYLCGADQGGTQFYRHDRTGYETVFPERQSNYMQARRYDSKAYGLRRPAYFKDTEHGFTRLKQVKARFNRAILYPSCTLHSGELGSSPKFTTRQDTGRLTVNTFFVPAWSSNF